MMGAQAWLRAFTTPGGFFVWLPQAVQWSKAKNGNANAARRFVKNTTYWSQIGGWFFTISTLTGSTYLFYPELFSATCYDTDVDIFGYYSYDSYGDRCNEYISNWCGRYDDYDFNSESMCCVCGGGSAVDPTGTSSSTSATIELGTTGYALGATLATIELIGWVLFYIGYEDSKGYARYLIQDQEGNFDNFYLNFTIFN